MKRRRMNPMTWYEHRRYNRLLEATRHVAPYIKFPWLRGEDQAYLDALRVVREYARGNALLAVAGDAVRRLARGRFRSAAEAALSREAYA